MATHLGVILQMDGVEATVALSLDRAAVARLVVQLAQADEKHKRLAARTQRARATRLQAVIRKGTT